MKVLIYTTGFAPGTGGIETFVALLARGLVERIATANKNGPDVPAASSDSVTVATATPADGLDDEMFSFRVVRRPPLLLLARLIKDADIIHLAGPSFVPLIRGFLLT